MSRDLLCTSASNANRALTVILRRRCALLRMTVRRKLDELSLAVARRQLGELHAITDSPYGRAYFADSYTGWQA